MDPQLAKLMARRRRKADGEESLRSRSVSIPMEEKPPEQETAATKDNNDDDNQHDNNQEDAKPNNDNDDDNNEDDEDEDEGINDNDNDDEATEGIDPPPLTRARSPSQDDDVIESEEESPVKKPSSVSSIRDALFPSSLRDNSDKSSIAKTDRSHKSADLPKAPSLIKVPKESATTGTPLGTAAAATGATSMDRTKRKKSSLDKKPRKEISEEEFSELDAVVAAVDASMEQQQRKSDPPQSPNAERETKKPDAVAAKTKSPRPSKSFLRETKVRSPVSSPNATKPARDAVPSTPPPPPPGPPQRSKSKSKGRSEEPEDSKPVRRRSNDDLRVTSEEAENFGHRHRAGRRRSNDSGSGSELARSPGSHGRTANDEGEDSGHRRRAGRRRSNDSEGSVSQSPGRNKARRGSRKNSDDGDDASPGRLKQRRGSRSTDDAADEGSPGRHKGRRGSRSTTDDAADEGSPGSHKHRGSSGSRTAEGDAGRSPGSVKPQRRRVPSRSRSALNRSKSSSQRPRLPTTLEEELSESAAARSAREKSSKAKYKMPMTMEEELLTAVASSPRVLSPNTITTRTRTVAPYSDEDEDSLDELMPVALSSKIRTRRDRDSSNKSRESGRKSRNSSTKGSRSQATDPDEYGEELVELNDASTGSKPAFGSQTMNFSFEDSTNFDNSFVIDLAATKHETPSVASTNTGQNRSQGASSAFDTQAFQGNFAMDFGSFSEDVTTSKPSRRIGKNATNQSSVNEESAVDAFGFSSEDMGAASASAPAPAFGNNLDFGGDGWGQAPKPVYEKGPIEKPPINQVESTTTKIKWISPRPNLVITASPNNQNPPPVSNPLNGNLIVCRPGSSPSRDPSCDIIEWSPQRQTQVHAISILTSDLKRKVVQKYGVAPEGVDAVWTISAGVHRAGADDNDALRVAALVDLTILGDRNKEVLRVIVVWNWWHDSSPLLQSVLSPPSGSDFTYDTKSLKIADGCVFVAGASAKGPCVFLNKPTVRETWSANFIAKNTDLRISSMAVTNAPGSSPDPTPAISSGEDDGRSYSGGGGSRRLTYLAVALNDGSLSVWTYEAATRLTGKTKEAVRKLLFPVCRLHAIKFLQSCPVTTWSSKERTDSEKSSQLSESAELGVCTHLEWIPYRASAHKQLPLLAATFQGAMCLYHVALPKVQDKTSGRKGSSYIDIKAPNEKTGLSQTISLRPFCYSKWASTHHRASCAFVDLGPHAPPSLVVLVRGSQDSPDYARVALVTCPISTYRPSKAKTAGEPLSFHVWDSHEWTNKKAQHLPRGLIHASLASTRGILYFTDTCVQELEYRTNTRFPMGTSGVGSLPCGLTTSGTDYRADSRATAGVGVLSLYTTFHSQRFKSTLSSDPTTPTLLEWTIPNRRHWIVQTHPADSRDSRAPTIPGGKSCSPSKGFQAEDDVVLGGAQSSLVCELTSQSKLQNLYPYRVSRDLYGSADQIRVAVWFRPLYGQTDPKTIGLVERDGDGRYGVVQLLDARDFVFLPPPDGDGTATTHRALVVCPNGGSVALWKRTKTSKALSTPWKKESSVKPCRPILGVDPKDADGFVELRQYVVARFLNQLSLVAIASGANQKFCLIAGSLVNEDGLDDWTRLLPNMKEDPVLWLEEREQVSLLVPLPGEGSIRGGLGVATTQRILILSPDLQVLSTVDSEMPPGSLVPMGSYTVAYCSSIDHKLRYLSGLPSQTGQSGVIANLPVPIASSYPPWLVGIRPDRILYNVHQNGTRLVERGQSEGNFLLPLATTRPALLLEPMVANAIATGGKDTGTQPFLRTVLEKFGRKVATMSHGKDEGIGNYGAGITPRVFELFEQYDLQSAASWLLTGTVRFDRSANSRLLPSYLPVITKAKAAFDADTHMHLIASGDQYFTEYIKSPDNNMSSTLPRPSDPTAALCRQFGRQAIQGGKIADAIKMLDISGAPSSDATVLQLALALQLDPSKDTRAIIDALADSQTGKIPSAVASLAALASELKKGGSPSPKFQKKWLQSLAPSAQRSRKGGRHRSRLLGESSLANLAPSIRTTSKMFSKEIPESKLVWNEGPSGEKESLLMLDNFGEWFGRKRPIVFGKEGAKSAEERGASTLAGILHSNDDDEDDDSFGGENDDDFKDGWVDGVGEGLKDEDKLSAYYRFSEGEDEEPTWQDEGIADITKYNNTAVIVGNPDNFALEVSKSRVDEGESGKVKAIYDLVFSQSGVGKASALAIPAARGCSLDLGVMHGPDQTSRQKCTIEFWVWVPANIKKEIVLVRRTFGSSADNFETVCNASDKGNLLWELGLQKSGELEFRTIAGKSVKTKPEKRDDNHDDEDDTPTSSVHFSRWNHICIIMKQESITSSVISLIVRGNRKTSPKSLSFSPPGFEVDDFSGASALDPKLEKSHLVYGLDHPKDFRMTELRVWALERKDDDIKTLMAEYLECAEIKRKFRIKIKKKSGGEKAGTIGLAPPKGSGLLAPPGGLRTLGDTPTKGGLLTPPGGKRIGLLAPPKSSNKEESPSKTELFGPSDFGTGSFENFESSKQVAGEASTPVSFGSDGFGNAFDSNFSDGIAKNDELNKRPFEPDTNDVEDEELSEEEEIEISPLWESAIPLSKQVRTSAASALIRGPPATRHFGGNRGGLPDYRELERFGVGAISICGSEKTIVWRDDQVPPGLTYPIGASGAIVSDQMDGDGSEFLCCFMAKDKRMVVFELSTRTIVVELQMTTKLNYWRFLPPEAGEDTLCFMLITPVGGFHWMPLDESPRPRQVWKRGPELQGKKIVSYEEGGTNGYEGQDMLSKVGLVLVTDSADMVGGGSLEAWLVPVCGDSQVVCASYEILGACLCQPPGLEYEAFMPLLLFVVEDKNELVVCVSAVTQEGENSIGLTEVMTDALIEQGPYSSFDFEPPSLAMGTYPEVLCCSLGTTVVVIVRRKGLVVAYELADSGLELIAQENVGHYVVDAVMRYNAAEGGAEIVLLMGDAENRRDGRVGTFCFRPAV